VILAASVFEISCGKTNRQSDRQTNAGENLTPATAVDVGYECMVKGSAGRLLQGLHFAEPDAVDWLRSTKSVAILAEDQ